MRVLKIIALTAFFFCLISGAALWAYRAYMPDVKILKTHYPVVTYFPETKKHEVNLRKGRPAGWVAVNEVSRAALGAIVVSEDSAFFQHDGYDLNQIQIVLQDSWHKKKLGRGASTITQQVVKNIFLTNERSIVRKVLELYLSTDIEHELTKWKILELYINIAEMGPGIFGIGEASRYYFSKSPKQLTAREGAFLAMLLPSPVRYSQSFREKKLTSFAKRIVESILDKMVVAGYISREDREALRASNLSFEKVPDIDPNFVNEEEGTNPMDSHETTPREDFSAPDSKEKSSGPALQEQEDAVSGSWDTGNSNGESESGAEAPPTRDTLEE